MMKLVAVLAGALSFSFLLGLSAPTPSASAAPYAQSAPCPTGYTDIWPGDDIASIVNAAPQGEQFCVHGLHRAAETLVPKRDQVFWGEDDGRISGAEELTGWTFFEDGVWVYTGPLAANQNIRDDYTLSGVYFACHEFSIYQDDVFYDDRRMMRVMSLDQLRGHEALPEGQAETPAEFGRFFFDYDNDAIYVNQDPTSATVDMTVLSEVFDADARDVEIRYLTIEKALNNVVWARNGQSWSIENSTIRFAHNVGIYVGRGTEERSFSIVDSLITNNGQSGIMGGVKYLLIRDTEISWNNIANYREKRPDGTCHTLAGTGGARLFGTDGGSPEVPSLVVDNVYAHHNLTDGMHLDIHAQYVSVTRSRFHDNERWGYFHEISCDAEVAYNEFARNGNRIKSNDDLIGGGVAVALSNYVHVHDNVFFRNTDRSLWLNHRDRGGMTGNPCMNVAFDTDVSDALKHNTVENNRVFLCEGTVGSESDDGLVARDNQYIGNRYLIPDRADADFWHDINGEGTFSWPEWQARGQDLTGGIFYHTGRCGNGVWSPR